ncbi:MAG: Hint domain-containing protein [Chloroflexi bacterium]|nr:Hint domain-containing protein [Chloroflexota bacterium]
MHRDARNLAGLLLAIIAVAGCSLLATPDAGSPAPSQAPGSTATPGPALSPPELKLQLVATYGPLWYCDPDFYPIQRADEVESAKTRWPEVQADAGAFRSIVVRLGLEAVTSFSDEQELAVYQAWKALRAIALNPIGNDTYRFDYLAQPVSGGAQGTRTAGRITTSGVITVEQQAAAGAPNCPICLARGTRIDGPGGRIAVEELRIGDPVWTLDADGRRLAATVIALGSMPAPASHMVVRLLLADGRTVTASPGHPLADGRRVGDVRPGDRVGGSVVRAADLLPYTGGRTYDIVVSGPTGIYLVDGIPLGSTLRP